MTVPRVDALRREGQEHILTDHQPRTLEERAQHLFGRPRVAGAGQDHELPGPLALAQRFADSLDRRGIRFASLAKRGMHADVDDVQIPGVAQIGHGAERTLVEHLLELGRREILDVAPAPAHGFAAAGVVVDSDNGEPGLSVGDGRRQADVPESHDTDPRSAIPNTVDELLPRAGQIHKGAIIRAAWSRTPERVSASVGPVRMGERTKRAPEQRDVQPYRPVLDIVEIEMDALVPGEPGAPPDLPQPGHPRGHEQAGK